ncbi:carboxypeptidase-like regulatory domain-containing protein [Dysgonomonas sp. OttesenSCG-928-M03]|nr:carboxypeptidase-like regulatory domain-containing protein [Dysgonomonas sp. OttesenSCG-928-M03]
MKTMYKQVTGIILILFVLAGFTPVQSKDNTHYTSVSGVVKDKRSKKKLEFVSITIPGTNIGTITNSDGEFTLKVKDSLQAKIVEVSHIGYANYQIPLTGEDIENTTVFLTANTKLLDEVVVNTMDPIDLIRTAISKKGDNYSDKPTLLTGFYRETVQKRRNFINISEAIIDIYKTSYDNQFNNIDLDRVQVFKGRQLLSIKPSDTLAVKFQGGPTLSTYADIVKNPDLILDIETLSFYKFKMEDPAMINERPHYVVSFAPQVVLPYALYYGKLYIDKQSLAFSRAEFSLSMDNRNKVTQAILKKKPYKLQFKPEEVSFLVTYNLRDGRSYLNYIRNTVRFKCDWKKKWIFSTGYTIVSEMVVTDGKAGNVNNIPNKLAFKQNQALSDKVSNFYDENFWEDYNIIEPTESLENAVSKLRKQYK